MSDKKLKYYIDKHSNPDKPSSDLSKLKNGDLFKLPDNYFDTLPGIVQEKVMTHRKELKPGFLDFYYKKSGITILIPVTLFVLVISVYFLSKKPEGQDVYSYITIDELLEDYPELVESMDESLFYDAFFAENDDGFPDFFNADFDIDNLLTDDDIFNYLSDDDIENDLINNL